MVMRMRCLQQRISASLRFVLGAGLSVCIMAVPASADLYGQPTLVVDPGMHTTLFRGVDGDRDWKTFVTGSEDKTLRIWAMGDKPKLIKTIRMPSGPGNIGKIFSVAMSPDGQLIAAGGWARWSQEDRQEQIYIFNKKGSMIKRIGNLPNVTYSLDFSPNGRYLAIGMFGGEGIRVYDGKYGWAEVARDTEYTDTVYGISFSPDGRSLASSDYDGTVSLYDSGFQRIARRKLSQGRRPFRLAFNPSGNRIAVGLENKPLVAVLDSRNLEPLAFQDMKVVSNRNLMATAWSQDGQTIYGGGTYSVGDHKPVVAWNGDRNRGVRRNLFSGALNTIFSIKALPNRELLVTSADPHLAIVGADGEARWAKKPLRFDPRGQRYNFSVSADGTMVEFGFGYGGKDRFHFNLRDFQMVKTAAPRGSVAPPRQKGLDN